MAGWLRHLPRVLHPARPVQFTLFLTRRCNARCPYCFYLRNTRDTPAAGAELTLAQMQRFAPGLGPLVWLAFSGGEIFLRRDLADIAALFYRCNRPNIMLYPTNGTLPARASRNMARILQRCPDSSHVVKLSIDELGPAHDRLRHSPGSFDRTLETLDRLARLQRHYPRLELGINTVFSAANQDRVDAIIDFVRTLPAATTHTLSLVRGDLQARDYLDVDLDKYQAACERLATATRDGSTPGYRFFGARLKASQDILQRKLILLTAREGRRQIPCLAGRTNLVMDCDGEVYPCEMRSTSLGNIHRAGYDIRALLDSARGRALRREIRDGGCHCTHECHMMTNILFNPARYPRLLGEYLSLHRPLARGPGQTGAVPATGPTDS